MQNKLTLVFVWQGVSQQKIRDHWRDGLYAAMKEIEKKHTVVYKEPWEDITEGDVILYWEAPCTNNGQNKEHYNKVRNNKIPKILLFAGGPVKIEDVVGFDLFLVESKINEEEFEKLGLPWLRAFGVNTDLLKPEKQPKVWDACFPATCASWKRLGLFSKALGPNGVLCGRDQPTDPQGFIDARKNGTTVFPELSYEAVNTLYNASWCCVNTSEFWGGGQRSTLESLAAGVPVIVMSDSPKNREYIEESGCGLVIDPSPEAIRTTVEDIKMWDFDKTTKKCVDYINSKWTHRHYAESILKGINKVLYES